MQRHNYCGVEDVDDVDWTGLVLLSMLSECFSNVPTFHKIFVCLYHCHMGLGLGFISSNFGTCHSYS